MRGGTKQSVRRQLGQEISIHPPHAGRDARNPGYGGILWHFNPPSPCGEGLQLIIWIQGVVIFQSTLPMRGGTRRCSRLDLLHEAFQSTLPMRGGTLSIKCSDWRTKYFNPPSPCGEGQHKFTKYIWKLMHISQNKPLTEEHTAKYSKFSPILWRILQFSFMRTYRGISVCFPFASLNNQHPLRLIGRFRTEMLNFCLIAVSQIVKSQTVLLLIHDPTQLML